MAVPSPIVRGLSDRDRQVLETHLVEFDQSWTNGLLAERARGLLAKNPLRLPALAEMVKIDMERQWQCGRRIKLESYLEQYPELGTAQEVSADMIQAEYEVCQQYGIAVDHAEIARRFPRQVDHLWQLLEKTAASETRSQAIHDIANTQTTGGQPTSSVVTVPEHFGRYRILRPLGRGGMGSVYLAHDTQLDREVALKIPTFAPEDGSEVLERFVREAQAAATINHPNICPVYDVGQIDGIHFLTMAHIEGRSLSDFVSGDKPLPQRQVATAVKKIALALQEAHQRGVIHRDLKPSNIMINKRREPVIMDFGLARRVNTHDARLTQNGILLGTPAYMPPEQIHGDLSAMGPRSDVYSLGVILYELLSSRLPFEGSPMAVLAQIQTQEPKPLNTFRADIDPSLDAICRKALSKKPSDRYGSMQELANVISEFLKTNAEPEKPRTATNPDASNGQLDQDILTVVAKIAEDQQFTAKSKTPTRGTPNNRRPWAIAIAAVLGILLLGGLAQLLPTKDGELVEHSPVALKPPENPMVLQGHDSHVNCVAFSPDGKWIASGSWDSTVKIWNAHTGVLALDLRMHSAGVLCVAFSPDGKRIASGSSDKTVKVCEAKTGELLYTLQGHTLQVVSVAFSPNGQRLVSGSGDWENIMKPGEVKVWDVQQTGKEIHALNGHNGWLTGVAYSPKTQRIVSVSASGSINTWDAQSGKKVLPHIEVGSGGFIHGIAFSPDGCFLVTGCGFYHQPEIPGQLKVWDARTGECIRTVLVKRHASYVNSVAFTPDGRHIVSGSGLSQEESAPGGVDVWDVQTGELLYSFEEPDYVTSVAVSRDGTRIVSGSRDGRVRIWELATTVARRPTPTNVNARTQPIERKVQPAADTRMGKAVASGFKNTKEPSIPPGIAQRPVAVAATRPGDLNLLPLPNSNCTDFCPAGEPFVAAVPRYGIGPAKGKEIVTPAGSLSEKIYSQTSVNLSMPGWKLTPSVEIGVSRLGKPPVDPATFLTELVAGYAGDKAELVRQYQHLGYPAVRFSTNKANEDYLQHHLFVLDGTILLRVETSNPSGVTLADADVIRDRFQPLRDRTRKTPDGWTEYAFLTGLTPAPNPNLPPGYDPAAYGAPRDPKSFEIFLARMSPAEREKGDRRAAERRAEREAKTRVTAAFPTAPELIGEPAKTENNLGVEWKASAICRRKDDLFVLRHGLWGNSTQPTAIPQTEELVERVGRRAAEQAAGPRGVTDFYRRAEFDRVDPKDVNSAGLWANPNASGGTVYGREYQATAEDGTVVRGVVFAKNGTVFLLEHRGPTAPDAVAFFDSVR